MTNLDNATASAPEEKAAYLRAQAAFPKYADALNQAPETLQVVLREIAEDPYTIFLDEVWN